jgi:hypothetical protein
VIEETNSSQKYSQSKNMNNCENRAQSMVSKLSAQPIQTNRYIEPYVYKSNKRKKDDDEIIKKEDYDNVDLSTMPFKTAKDQYLIDCTKKQPQNSESSSQAKRPMISNNQISNPLPPK